MKKVLIITPRSPFQERGADEADRLAGIRWFKDQGFEVHVITKVFPSDLIHILKAEKELDIKITPVLYKYAGLSTIQKIPSFLKRILWPAYWDGAAYEYFDPEIKKQVKKECEEWRPDLVWFDYTYLWPLYGIVKKNKILIITRSINFEPEHFLDEDGRLPWNYVRAIPKLWSEWKSFNESDYFFSITPKEEKIYKRLGPTPVTTLPLRSLPDRVEKKKMSQTRDKIRIGFMPSTYTVHHNLEALKFIVEDVLPLIPDVVRAKLSVHITGNRLSKEMKNKLPKEVVYEGFVPSSIEFWLTMDIALAPSLFGAGMQQKIFEPLALGLPTITSKRGLGGYPFISGESVLTAHNKKIFADQVVRLVEDSEFREYLGQNAKKMAKELFSAEIIDGLLRSAV